MDNPESQAPAAPEPAKPGFFKRILHHPNFNALCGVVTIISLLFGVWCWRVSIRERNLTYYVSPTRTSIVKKANLNTLSASFSGIPITGDLSSVHIQLWNQGKEPIRREDILKVITIRMTNNAPIYQVGMTCNRASDITGFNISTFTNGPAPASLPTGSTIATSLPLDWRILENDDGVDLQIIYGGDVTLPLVIEGAIVGQKRLTQFNTTRPTQQQNLLKFFWILFWLFLLASVNVILLHRRLQNRSFVIRGRNVDSDLLLILTLAQSSCMVACILAVSTIIIIDKPPFGF